MSIKNESWFHRVAAGRSRTAMRVGVAAFALSVAAVPLLFRSFLNLYANSNSMWFAYFCSAVMCIVWLIFANDVRKFSNGERLINQLRSTDGAIRTIGTLRNEALARWATLLFDAIALLGIGWFAMYAASAA